jgi:hypothetical protein
MSLPIKAFSPKEVKEEISRLNPRKAPGYDLITGQVLQANPKKLSFYYATYSMPYYGSLTSLQLGNTLK